MNESFRFQEKRIYKGTIAKQSLTIDERSETPVLSLWIDLVGELVDGRNTASGTLPLPGKYQPEVRLRFDPSKPESMDYAIQDLARLVFEDEDISKLSPKHAAAVSFVGAECYLAPRYKTMGDREDCYWNLRFPKAAGEEEQAAIADVAASSAAEEFRRMMLARKRPGSADAAPAAATEEAPAATTGRKSRSKTPF